MKPNNDLPVLEPSNRAEWRAWLKQYSRLEQPVRLVIHHKNSPAQGIRYEEAVEEALCFGWIDSRTNKRDPQSFYQIYSRRKPGSYWSSLNKERAARLIREKKMTKPGLAAIDLARENGQWDIPDDPAAPLPEDLQQLFDRNKIAHKHFLAFAPSSKRQILGWILNAKRPETRKQRIALTVALAAENIKAHHP